MPRPPRPPLRIAPLLAAIGSLAATLALEAAGTFSLASRTLHLEEVGSVTNWVLTVDRGRFAFMAPARWRIERAANDPLLQLWSPKGEQILIRLEDDNPAAKPTFNLPALKEKLLVRFKDAEVVGDGVCHTEAESGVTFDLAWAPNKTAGQRLRFAFVRVGDTPFSFALSASTDRFESVLPVFLDLLTSFQADVPPR